MAFFHHNLSRKLIGLEVSTAMIIELQLVCGHILSLLTIMIGLEECSLVSGPLVRQPRGGCQTIGWNLTSISPVSKPHLF